METMPPYTYKFVKNQTGNSTKQKKIGGGYLSKDVKVINDLIDDLSKLKVDNAAAEMTKPLQVDQDKGSSQSISSSSTHRSVEEKPKLKEQVQFFKTNKFERKCIKRVF